MKTITIEIEEDEVLVAVKRPEEYEDVDPVLVIEDVFPEARSEYRIVWPKEAP